MIGLRLENTAPLYVIMALLPVPALKFDKCTAVI